jgi:monoamine oxidase
MIPKVAIVGAGLAGLTVAYRLQQAGIRFDLLEARDRLGGRILSVHAGGRPAAGAFDLGPAWIWPAMQPTIAALVDELGLQIFEQHSDGDVVVERGQQQIQRFQTRRQEPPSMRFAGGASALISALAGALTKGSIQLSTRITAVSLKGAEVCLTVERSGLAPEVRTYSHAILALPPRLLEASVTFTPALDGRTTKLWRNTATWMAPHAKFMAVYDRPFWREAGLSGTAQSMVGPMVEIHDATTADGQAALFGFVGVPADARRQVERQALIDAGIQQMARLFGAQAGSPKAAFLQDWAADPLTATDADMHAGEHPMPASSAWVTGEWATRILLAGSETSSTEPGYLSGAVEAGNRAANELQRRLFL